FIGSSPTSEVSAEASVPRSPYRRMSGAGSTAAFSIGGIDYGAMECPRCHADNRVGRRFCGECGLSLASVCPSCGFTNHDSERFCGGCGALIASPRQSSLSPDSYTPKDLAQKILTSKTALEGE